MQGNRFGKKAGVGRGSDRVVWEDSKQIRERGEQPYYVYIALQSRAVGKHKYRHSIAQPIFAYNNKQGGVMPPKKIHNTRSKQSKDTNESVPKESLIIDVSEKAKGINGNTSSSRKKGKEKTVKRSVSSTNLSPKKSHQQTN